MQLSASSNHALRVVALLAADASAGPVLGRDLAATLGVPADYLLKVLARLTRAGVLSATRGLNGGYRLARDADRIPLIDVVQPFEGERTRPRCLLRPGEPCRERDACGAHDAWCLVQGTYQDFLSNTTVADIQHDNRPNSRKKGRRRT